MGKNYMPCTHTSNCIMTGYYDYVLGAIPLALLGGTGLLSATGISLSAAVPLAALLAVLVIGHALFVNAPTDDVDVAVDTTGGASTANATHSGPVNAD